MAKIADAMSDAAWETLEAIYRRDDKACDSPIERIFLLAFSMHYLVRGMPRLNNRPRALEFDIKTQNTIGPYRVDFLITCERDAQIIVECDGHDFHEKTKQQAARDKARDRFLQGKGFVVLHFTGSELWADPMSCAEQVVQMFLGTLQRDWKIMAAPQKDQHPDG